MTKNASGNSVNYGVSLGKIKVNVQSDLILPELPSVSEMVCIQVVHYRRADRNMPLFK